MTIQEHVPLAPLTTFNIGGTARYFMHVQDMRMLREALTFAQEKRLPTFFLGGGSNVLFDDTDFDGLVIHIGIRGVKEEDDSILIAGAGESWDELVAYAVRQDMWGIENLSGIPGTVGGAVVQNIGAYGAALSQVLEWVDVYNTQAQAHVRLTKDEYASGYRDSIFKRTPGRYVVVGVAIQLSANSTADVSYKDLAGRFAGAMPSLGEVREAVLDIRRAKFPDLAVEGTAGSFFKNPIVSPKEAQALKSRYPKVPLFSVPESDGVKVPLGWFLDYRNGVMDMRTMHVGGARLYEKQFLVVAARRGTTARDVRELAHAVQEKVFAQLNLKIEPEVCIV